MYYALQKKKIISLNSNSQFPIALTKTLLPSLFIIFCPTQHPIYQLFLKIYAESNTSHLSSTTTLLQTTMNFFLDHYKESPKRESSHLPLSFPILSDPSKTIALLKTLQRPLPRHWTKAKILTMSY